MMQPKRSIVPRLRNLVLEEWFSTLVTYQKHSGEFKKKKTDVWVPLQNKEIDQMVYHL